MARYGIISDIHSNAEALDVALTTLEAEGVDKILCLGDIVGYGADPSVCIERIRALEEKACVICGNHDRQMYEPRDENMRETAAIAIEWTKAQVSDDQRNWLYQLPTNLVVNDEVMICHGSIFDPDAYILSLEEVLENFEVMEREYKGIDMCFFGHTHLPMVISTDGAVVDIPETSSYHVEKNIKYLVNPGSVGQARDRTPLSSFSIYDSDELVISFFRRRYDIEATQEKIRKAGLPDDFADRLSVGM